MCVSFEKIGFNLWLANTHPILAVGGVPAHGTKRHGWPAHTNPHPATSCPTTQAGRRGGVGFEGAKNVGLSMKIRWGGVGFGGAKSEKSFWKLELEDQNF